MSISEKVYPKQRKKKLMPAHTNERNVLPCDATAVRLKETQADQTDVLQELAEDTVKKLFGVIGDVETSQFGSYHIIYRALQEADKHGCQRGIRDASDDDRIERINKLLQQYGETEHPSFQILNQIAEITGFPRS